MKHRINPTVDYAFKLLLGSEDSRDLLLHFLNGLLKLPEPIVDLQLLNPFNPAEFDGDSLTIVDVKAIDALGRLYQIEVQLRVRPRLAARILYSWADLYQSQLTEGADFEALRPVISIWILDEDLLRGQPAWHHRFELLDRGSGHRLTEHLAIHTVELKKWRGPDAPGGALDAGEEWIYFLKEARNWDTLPPGLTSPEMKKAMAILNRISDKQANYLAYQARANYQRELRTLEKQLAEERAAKEQERAAKEQERAAKDLANAELEQLRARLRALGQDPDAQP